MTTTSRRTIGRLLAAAVVLATSFGLSAPAHASGSDYVTNGTFESGTATGWANDGNTVPLAVTTAAAHSGSYSMAPAMSSGYFDVNDSPNTISDSQAVGLSWAQSDLWVKGSAGATVKVILRNSGYVSDSFTLTGGWDHLVGTPTRITSGVGVDFHIANGTVFSSSQIYIDDVHLWAGSDSVNCNFGYAGSSVSNCSFEDPYNLGGWTTGSDGTNSTLSIDTVNKHTGTQSAQLRANVAGTVTLNDVPDTRSNANWLPSTLVSCTATAWVQVPNQHGAVKIRLREYSETNALLGTDSTSWTPSTSGWQQLTVTHILNANHTTDHLDLNIYATSQSVGDTVNIDDVSETCA